MRRTGGRAKWWVLAGGMLTVAVLGGLYLAAQVVTWVPEQNRRLPAPRYLEHSPQYVAPSPAKDGSEP